jgi:hypothetical protein
VANDLFVAAMAFTYLFGGALIGFAVQNMLPQHHLSYVSQDALKLGAGLIASLAALVLGLFVASSKSSFDVMNAKIQEVAGKTVVLGQVLKDYGPEADIAHTELEHAVAGDIARVWPEEISTHPDLASCFTGTVTPRKDLLTYRIRNFIPRTDQQKELQSRALQLAEDLQNSRWLLIEEQSSRLPVPILAVTLFWLTILNMIFSLLAPRNFTVLAVMFACSLSIAGAIFLFLEMDSPLTGIIKVYSDPLWQALGEIGKQI